MAKRDKKKKKAARQHAHATPIQEQVPHSIARRVDHATPYLGHPRAPRMLSGMRATFNDALARVRQMQGVAEPTDPLRVWYDLDLDAESISKMAPAKLLELMTEVSPDISRAMWDFLRMCNPGWEADAIDIKGKKVGGPAQDALDTFIKELKSLYGSFDVIINRFYIGAFLRGGFYGELVLNRAGKRPVDIAAPDPKNARYRKRDDPERGSIWQLGQYRDGEWEDLTVPTVRYIPIDPPPDSPYGRPMAMPALFTALFTIGMLHDLRRVVQQQGYPRLDIEVSLEELAKAVPPEWEDDPNAFREYVDDVLASVIAIYAELQPDDAYVHTSAIKVNRPIGTVDSGSLGAVDGLIRALERMTIRALKTMPLLMGSNEGTTETSANRQWEVYAAGIKALQHLAESLLEHLLTLALQAQGIVANVQFRFAELRASELMRDAQVQQLRTQNAYTAWLYGWISHDEAAIEVVGHAADNHSGPRYMPSNLLPNTPTMPNLLTVNPEPGESRGATWKLEQRDRARRDVYQRTRQARGRGTTNGEPREPPPSVDEQIAAAWLVTRGWTPSRLRVLVETLYDYTPPKWDGDEPSGNEEKPPYTPNKLMDYPMLVQPQAVGMVNGNGKKQPHDGSSRKEQTEDDNQT